MYQVMKEHKRATSAIKRYQEAHELAERQTLEIKRLKSAIEVLVFIIVLEFSLHST